MSSPISNIKNSSGTIDAYVANADVANSFEGFASMEQKMLYLSGDSYPEIYPEITSYTSHDDVLPIDSGGSLVLNSYANYFTAEFDVSSHRGRYLVFVAEHLYEGNAFVVVDDDGTVLAKDNVTSTDAAVPIVQQVLIPSTASKAYVGFQRQSYLTEDQIADYKDRVCRLYSYLYTIQYPKPGSMFFTYVVPDGYCTRAYIHPSATIGRAVHRFILLSNANCVAYKRLAKGTVFSLATQGGPTICPYAITDDNMAIVEVKNDLVQDGDFKLIKTMPCNGYLFWNFVDVTDVSIRSDEQGVPPASNAFISYSDYDIKTSPVEFTWNESKNGYYSVYTNNEFESYDGIRVSNHIQVSFANTLWLRGTFWLNVPVAVAFDSDGNKVMQWPQCRPFHGTSLAISGYIDEPIVLPNSTSYVILQDVSGVVDSTVPDDAEPPELMWYYGASLNLTDNSHLGNVLYGKKLVTAGDSYTEAKFTGDADNGKNFGYYIAQRNSMEFVNDGISGSTMALDKDYVASPGTVDVNTNHPFSYMRYKQVPSDTDYLIIWFGINDAYHTNLGTINDTTNETFYGAWNVVLKYYLQNMPFMKVLIIVTTGASENYRNAVRQVAKKWGYPVLDWMGDPNVPCFFDRESDIGLSQEARDLRREAFGYNDYNAHPSPAFHKYESTVIENFLRSL